MKFSVAVQDLQQALRAVKDIKLVAGLLEGTCAVLLQVFRTKVVFTAFNGELLVRASAAAASEGDAELVIDASALYSAVAGFHPMSSDLVGTTDVEFQISDKTKKLTFSATTRYANGKKVPHKRVVPLMGREGFPDFSSLDALTPTFSTTAARLTSGIDGAAFALSTDKNNIIFTGLYIQAVDGKLRQVATNGICLAEFETELNYSQSPVSVVVPGAVVGRISKSFSEDETVDVCITDKHFFVRSPSLLVGGPLIREDYPDYKAVIRPAEHKARLNKTMLLENLLNLSYEASSIPDNRVSMLFTDGLLSLKCGGSENGEIECEGYDGSFRVDCNLKLLVSAVKNLYGSSVDIGFSTPDSPVHFFSTENDGDGNLSCLLVPLSPE